MATQPRLPADEAPLDEASVDLFLSNMDTDMVLVGGQALAFWMSRFGQGTSQDRLGSKIQRVYTLAGSQVGRWLLGEHQVELLDAVDIGALKALAPAHGLQLDAVERAKAARHRRHTE